MLWIPGTMLAMTDILLLLDSPQDACDIQLIPVVSLAPVLQKKS